MMFATFVIISAVLVGGAYLFSRTNEVDVNEELIRMREKFAAQDGSTSTCASERELEDALSEVSSGMAERTEFSVFSDQADDSATEYGSFDPLSQDVYHEDYSST